MELKSLYYFVPIKDNNYCLGIINGQIKNIHKGEDREDKNVLVFETFEEAEIFKDIFFKDKYKTQEFLSIPERYIILKIK